MEHNMVVNRYLSDNERYADLINGCEFAGKQIVTAADLSDVDTQVNASADDKTGRRTRPGRKTKYRDIARKVAFGIRFMVIGIENQEEVHYLMPLRTMEYDVREYQRQAAIIRKKVRSGKKLTAAEYLSGFTKEEKLHPCVTFVLYYGDEWDGGRELHELLDFTGIPEQMKALVENDEAYRSLDEDAYDMVALYTHSTELLEVKKRGKKGDGVDMCQAIKEMLADERTEGRAEGRLHDVVKVMKNLKLTAEQAMDVLEIPSEERSRYMEKL